MAIRSFVSIKPVSVKSPIDEGFASIGKGINRIGTTTESIGNNFQTVEKLIKFERKWLSDTGRKKLKDTNEEAKDEKKTWKSMFDAIKKKWKKNKRKQAEISSEKGLEEAKEEGKKIVEKAKTPIFKFLKAIGDLLGGLLQWFVGYAALDWLSKTNTESLTKVFRAIFAIGKFIVSIIGFGVNQVLNGLTNLIGRDFGEGPVKRSLRGLLGAFQLIGGIAALKTAQWLIMPWKAITDFRAIGQIFSKQSEIEAENAFSRKQRINGYRDTKTGVIYSKEEYEANMKSARRADAKRGARAGKGMTSNLYESEMNKRFQAQYRGKNKNVLQKGIQRTRIGFKKGPRALQKNFLKPGFQKGLAVVGGATRIAAGLASGEDATSAIGAGAGQAIGGIAGAAAMTAVAPFLGPFAPIIGNALGSFLGEWVGKSLAPVLKPLFEPIGRYFSLLRDYVGTVWKAAGGAEWIGQLGELFGALWSILKPVLGVLWSFIKFVTGASFKAIGKIVGFVVNNAKRLMNPGSIVGGVVDFLTFGLTDADGMSREKGGPVNVPHMAAGGGMIGPQISIMQAIGGALLGGVVGGIAMLGFAAGPAMAFIGGDVARLTKLFGTRGASGGGAGLSSSMGSINTGSLKDSSTQEKERMIEHQKGLIAAANSFNELVIKAAKVFDPEFNQKEDISQNNGQAESGPPVKKVDSGSGFGMEEKAAGGFLGINKKDLMPLMAGGGHIVTSKMGQRGFKLSPGMHMGVDIAAEIGEPLYAFTDGRIEAKGWEKGYGNYVSWVDSNGNGHFFAHLDKPAPVQVGQSVKKGTIVGYAGNTGKSSGPHLHWEMARNPADTGMPKSSVLSRINPLDHFSKEAPFGGTISPNLLERSKPKAKDEASITETKGTEEEVSEKTIAPTSMEQLEKALGDFGKKMAEAGRATYAEDAAAYQAKLVATDVKAMTSRRTQQQKSVEDMMLKARRDKDRNNFIAPPMIVAQRSTQTIINKSGSAGTKVVYTKPSPLLTLC